MNGKEIKSRIFVKPSKGFSVVQNPYDETFTVKLTNNQTNEEKTVTFTYDEIFRLFEKFKQIV